VAIHGLDQYRGTLLAARYALPASIAAAEADALKRIVFGAVARIVRDQPLLRVSVLGEDSKRPAFAWVDRIDLSEHIEWRPIEKAEDAKPAYSAVLASEIDTKFSDIEARPGWKIVVLHVVEKQVLDVVYVWNHQHHDGTGSKLFHRALLRNLQECTTNSSPSGTGLESEILEFPDHSSDVVPPPPEVLCKWPATMPYMVRRIWCEIRPQHVLPKDPKLAYWAPIRTAPYGTKYRTITVENGALGAVVKACRQRGATITSLLHALTLMSMTARQRDAKGFACRTPYDLRRFLPSDNPDYPGLKPSASMCNYVSVLDHLFEPDEVKAIRKAAAAAESAAPGAVPSGQHLEMMWSIAARVRGEIKASLDSGVKNDAISVMKFVGDWRSQQEAECRKPRKLSWLVTNIGVLDRQCGDASGDEEANSWSIQEAEFVLSADVPSAALCLSVISVEGGSMSVTCSWQEGAIEASLGEGLTEDLEVWLRDIGSKA
jgi:hypothetical protein